MTRQQALNYLKKVFLRNGYARLQDQERLKFDRYNSYKKGNEVRLVAKDATELEQIRLAIQIVGIKPANSFLKGTQFIQPIYGYEMTYRFIKWKNAKKIK